MLQKPKFEQEYWSRTAEGNYKTGHYSIRLLKWLTYYNSSYNENICYNDMMEYVLSCPNEKS